MDSVSSATEEGECGDGVEYSQDDLFSSESVVSCLSVASSKCNSEMGDARQRIRARSSPSFCSSTSDEFSDVAPSPEISTSSPSDKYEGTSLPGYSFHVNSKLLEKKRPRPRQKRSYNRSISSHSSSNDGQANKELRSKCEKERRDMLNAHIGQLGKLIPIAMMSTRKMDKSSVLRLAVNHLRVDELHPKNARNNEGTTEKWRPAYLKPDINMLLEALESFLIVIRVCRSANILLATPFITTLLGCNLLDIFGRSLYDLVIPEDHGELMAHLKRPPGNSPQSDNTHISFKLRMVNSSAHSNPKGKPKLIEFNGSIKEGHRPTQQAGQEIRELEYHLVCIGCVVKDTIMELEPARSMDSDEWTSHHNMRGQIIYSDASGCYLTGFLPSETIGTSAYSLVFKDDLLDVVLSHMAFLGNGSIPTTVFRMLKKSTEVMYIKNQTHLVPDPWTKKPLYIMSHNVVIKKEEAEILMPVQRSKIEELTDSIADMSILEEYEIGEDNVEGGSVQLNYNEKHEKVVIPRVFHDGDKIVIICGMKKYVIDLVKLMEHQAGNQQDQISTIQSTKMPLVPPKFLGVKDDDQQCRTYSSSSSWCESPSTSRLNSCSPQSSTDSYIPSPGPAFLPSSQSPLTISDQSEGSKLDAMEKFCQRGPGSPLGAPNRTFAQDMPVLFSLLQGDTNSEESAVTYESSPKSLKTTPERRDSLGKSFLDENVVPDASSATSKEEKEMGICTSPLLLGQVEPDQYNSPIAEDELKSLVLQLEEDNNCPKSIDNEFATDVSNEDDSLELTWKPTELNNYRTNDPFSYNRNTASDPKDNFYQTDVGDLSSTFDYQVNVVPQRSDMMDPLQSTGFQLGPVSSLQQTIDQAGNMTSMQPSTYQAKVVSAPQPTYAAGTMSSVQCPNYQIDPAVPMPSANYFSPDRVSLDPSHFEAQTLASVPSTTDRNCMPGWSQECPYPKVSLPTGGGDWSNNECVSYVNDGNAEEAMFQRVSGLPGRYGSTEYCDTAVSKPAGSWDAEWPDGTSSTVHQPAYDITPSTVNNFSYMPSSVCTQNMSQYRHTTHPHLQPELPYDLPVTACHNLSPNYNQVSQAFTAVNGQHITHTPSTPHYSSPKLNLNVNMTRHINNPQLVLQDQLRMPNIALQPMMSTVYNPQTDLTQHHMSNGKMN